MSDVIDTSVVKLGFDSREFVNNVNMSIMAVDALKESLVFDSKSFDSLTKAANNIDLTSIATNVQSLSDRFSTFGIVGMTAIQKITESVMDLGAKLFGLLAKPWKQILTGGWSRASNIGQAKFQLEGLFGKSEEGAAKLNMTMMGTAEQIAQLAKASQGFSEDMIVAMNAADYAVADTAYGLDSAAKAASVLATSGVDVVHFSEDLKDANGQMRTEMQVALRSISGVAAMANTSYDEIAHVFERVSGNGRIMAIDLQSLSARGLNAAATLRDYLNEIGETSNATEADIRDMVSKGKIDFMTFAKAMDSAYGDHAKDANNTFSGAFSNMKFALSKIGADFITPIRNKMVPLFNDIRISINQVRKALNFKMKFDGLDEEISLVELFTRVIHNLTAKVHDLFTVWHGGQNVMEQAMAGFSNKTGQSLERIKSVFDRVTKGTETSEQGIRELTDIAKFNGVDLTDVYKNLGETFEKTEDQIKEMCRNGEISFEDFYRALSSVFGSDIQDTRISQLASLVRNLVGGFINLARTITGIVGPVIYAFFQVFNAGGIKGIVGITEAFAQFTSTLVASKETQEKIRKLAFSLFSILKSGLSVIKKIISMILKVAQALAPLVIQVLEFADVIASIISYIVDIIVESKLLESVITVVGKAFEIAGYLIVNVFRIILALVKPVMKAIGEVFAFLARSIGSIDVSFIGVIGEAFKRLADTIINGGVVTALTNAVQIIFLTIERMFKGLTLSFEVVSEVLHSAAERVSEICDRVVTMLSNLKNSIVYVFNSLQGFLKDLVDHPGKIVALIGQLTSLTILFRFAQTMRGIGRAFSGLGNYLNSNAILSFVNAIKTLATAILEFSVAIVLLSSIPKYSLQTTISLIRALTISVAIFLGMYFTYMYMIARLNNKIIADPMVRFMNKLNSSINAFLQSIGRAANISALALLLIAMAASVAMLFKSVQKFAEFDSETFERGFLRVADVVLLLAAFLGIVAGANGARFGKVQDSVIFGKSGLMGAAVVLMALLIVIRAFEQIIIEYNSMDISEEDFYNTILRIASVMAMLALSIGLMGLTVKQAGFGLMGAVSAMMAFLTVLEAFESIIRIYADLYSGENALDPDVASVTFATIASIIGIVVAGISAMALAMSQGSSSFSAGIKTGIDFKSNSAKFLGIVLTMLSLCLVLRVAASAMAVIGANAGEDYKNADAVIVLLLTIFGGLYFVINAMNGISTGSIIGLGVILVILSSVLPLLSSFDWKKIAASAASLSGVIAFLSLLMHSVSGLSGNGWAAAGSIAFMLFAIGEVAAALMWLSFFDAEGIVAAGMGLAMVIGAFAMMFMTISKFQYNKGTIGFIFSTLLGLVPIMAAMAVLSLIPYDPVKLVALVGTMSVLALAIGGMMKLMSGTNIVNAGSIFVTLIGIAISISILAAALSEAAVILDGHIDEFGIIALCINCLIPIIAAIWGLATYSSKLLTSWNGILMMATIIAMVSGLIFSITAAATFGNAEGTVAIMKGIQESILGLTGLIGAIAGIALVFGAFSMTGIGVGALLAGIALMGLMLTELAAFIGMVTASATLGNADATVTLFAGLGTSLDAMVPFLLKMGAICTVFGLVSPILAAGSVGFGVLMSVIAAFVGMIAFVATLGDPENTVTLLLGLTKAMDRFNEFLGHFVLVLTLLGTVAPLAAIGTMVFKAILDILSNFAMSMTIIGRAGNVSNTVTMMTAITGALKELVNSFLILMVLGVMAAPVIAGMLLITTAMSMLLGISIIIGQIDSIRNAIVSGIMTILLSAESLVAATSAMSNIDLAAIVQFIFALGLISLAPDGGISKFAMIASTMSLIGVSSNLVLKGAKASFEMIAWLNKAANSIRDILRINTSKLVSDSQNILLAAYNMSKMAATYHIAGMIKGLLDPNSLSNLAKAAAITGWVVAAAIRNVLGIHSPGTEGAAEMDYHILGMDSSLTDSSNLNMLLGDGSNLLGQFGSGMTDLAGMYGSQAGASYAENFGSTLFEFLEYSVEGWSDAINYFGGDALTAITGSETLGTSFDAARLSNVRALNSAADSNNAYADSLNNVDEAERNYINNNGTRPYFSPNLVHEETLEDQFESVMGDWTDFSWLYEAFDTTDMLGSIGDIDSAIGGLTEDSEGASRAVDDLIKKLDSLMDKYENIWEDAKERANKDLFKGVDKQGDDFLDSVQDIMDKFKNIYQDAVEKTNGQNLFAEVKDEDESFAPETLLNNLEDQVNQVNELNTIISSLGGRIADNNLRAAISAMDVDDLPELRALYRMSDSQLSEYEQMYAKKVTANQNKIQNELTGSLSQLTGKYTNVATYIADDATTNMLMNNLQQQIDELDIYNATVASLMERIADVNLREAISHMGVESLAELRSLNSMTDVELDKYVSLYNKKMSSEMLSIKNELSSELSALLGQPIDIEPFYNSYDGTMESVAAFLSGNPDGALRAGDIIASNMGKGISRNLASNSNKEVSKSSGKELASSVADGLEDKDQLKRIEDNSKNIVEIIKNVLEDARNGLKESGGKVLQRICSGLDYARGAREFYDCVGNIARTICNIFDSWNSSFYNVGLNVVLGLQRGMKNNTNLVTAEATNLAYKTLITTQQALEIGSPSRAFMKIGRYLDEGLAIGLRDYANLPENEAEVMAEGSLSAVQEAIQQLSGMLDGSIDINPVITPTLDLSEVNARSAALANMFNGRQIAVQARADDQQAEMMTQLGNILAEQNAEPRTITFNQTNNSPKALSRTEIYRQTRNGFSQLASAIQ